MGKFFLTVLVGAAVAGVVYYLYDKEGAEKLMGNVRDAASDAFDKASSKFSKTAENASKAYSNA